MKGYFSRLVPQTGITFEPSEGSRSTGIERTSFKRRGNGVITPFHFEEDAVIHSEQNRIIEPTDDRIVEDSEGSYHISENEPKRQPVEERHETGIGKDSQSQLSGSQKSDLPEEKREETKNDDTNMELQLPLPDRRETGLVKSNFFPEGEGMIVANMGTNEPHVESDAGPFTRAHQQEIESAFKRVITGNEKISQSETPHSYLSEVRRWVAETQEDKQLELNNGDRVRADEIKRAALTSIDDDRGLLRDYYGQKESGKNNEVEVNDFHLSIGAINLTIEEPRNEVQTKIASPTKLDQGKRQLPGDSRRLNRHYIRIR